jgi:Jacalin-like lectin domain
MRRIIFSMAILATAVFWGTGLPLWAQQLQSTEIAGGSHGRPFSDMQPPGPVRVMEVRIYSGDVVDSVQMVYALPNGGTTAGPRNGGSGGRLSVFNLGPDEFITGISGRCGDYIDSLRIHTNRRTSPTYGGRGGNRDFRISIPPGTEAVGFAGQSGEYLDALGLLFTSRSRDTFGRNTPGRDAARIPRQDRGRDEIAFPPELNDTQQRIYRDGFLAGKEDALARMSQDYRRYRDRFNRGSEGIFRRGYEAGWRDFRNR